MKYYNEKMECMDRNERKALQGERLKKIVRYEYDRVKTYRDKMDAAGISPDDINSIDDIVKLPFTEKIDLRNGYPFGMFAVPNSEIVRLHASSGTTGKLTVVGFTQNDLDNWTEALARGLYSCGVDNTSTVNVAYGYGLFTGGLGAHYGAEKIGATVVPVSTGGTQKQLALIRDFNTDTICCTPSYAQYLGEEAAKIEGYTHNLKRGIFGAEPWTEEMRKEIEKSLHLKAYNIYGLSEISGPGVACECEYQDGCHIQEDIFYPEIIDPKTLQPVKEGETGELVFTTLLKEGIPLIRYRTHDICSLIYEPCKCGRTTVRMNRIFGRSDDMLIIRGVNVFPSQIESVLLNIGEGVMPFYQIIVDRVNFTDTIEIRVEISDELFSDEVRKIESLKKRIETEMVSALSIRPKITFVGMNSLPRNTGEGNKMSKIVDNRKFN